MAVTAAVTAGATALSSAIAAAAAIAVAKLLVTFSSARLVLEGIDLLIFLNQVEKVINSKHE